MVPVVQARLCIILRTVCRTEVYVLNPQIMRTTEPDKPLPRLHCMSHDHTGSFCIRCGGKPEDGPDWVNSPCMGVNRSPILPPPRPPAPSGFTPRLRLWLHIQSCQSRTTCGSTAGFSGVTGVATQLGGLGVRLLPNAYRGFHPEGKAELKRTCKDCCRKDLPGGPTTSPTNVPFDGRPWVLITPHRCIRKIAFDFCTCRCLVCAVCWIV